MCAVWNLNVRVFWNTKSTDLSRTIPLALHGDDAESHRRRSFCICTVGSVTVHGNTWDTKMLVFCLDNSQCTAETSRTLDLWLTWSLLELSLGHFLDKDPYGNPYGPYQTGARVGPIAEGWRAVLAVQKGDEKYIQRVFHTSHSWVSEQVCLLCEASQNRADRLYTEWGPTAKWRSTMVTTEKFIEVVVRTQTFVTLPGWHIENLQHDLLHVLDLAIIPECAASALTLELS